MQSTKISVIIPIFNGADKLPRAISSVQNQTFADFELIIVDDGSTDNTKSVAGSFAASDPRIKYFSIPHSGGPAKPINEGLKISNGKFVALLEHDDEWLPTKLEKQLDMLQSRNDIAMVGCEVVAINEVTKNSSTITLSKNKSSEQWLRSMLEDKGFFFNLSTLMLKKEKLGSDVYFDESLTLAADRDFYIRTMTKGFDIVPEVLVNYYSNIGSLSKNRESTARIIEDTLKILEKHQNIFTSYPKAQALLLGYVGVLFLSEGNKERGWEFIRKSIKIYPINLKLYVKIIILTVFGTNSYFKLRNFYFGHIKIH